MAPGVKRLSMVFSFKSADGHMGARYDSAGPTVYGGGELMMGGNRKFWQTYLPNLQYHNPGVEMDVHRTRETGGPSTLTIEFGMLASCL